MLLKKSRSLYIICQRRPFCTLSNLVGEIDSQPENIVLLLNSFFPSIFFVTYLLKGCKILLRKIISTLRRQQQNKTKQAQNKIVKNCNQFEIFCFESQFKLLELFVTFCWNVNDRIQPFHLICDTRVKDVTKCNKVQGVAKRVTERKETFRKKCVAHIKITKCHMKQGLVFDISVLINSYEVY